MSIFGSFGKALFGGSGEKSGPDYGTGGKDLEGDKARMDKVAALLGQQAQMSMPMSPGSITPQFGKLGAGGGAASGLGPVIQPSASPLAGLEAGLSGVMGSDALKKLMQKWSQKPAQPTGYPAGFLNE